MLKKIAALLALALGLSGVVWADRSKGFFQDSFGNYQEELKTAQQEGKKALFVFFMMDECPFCERMETTILSQPDVQAFYHQHFANFIFDIEGDVEVTDFKGKVRKQKDIAEKDYRVRATPVMMFFDLNGHVIARYTGATRNKAEFLLFGQYIVDEAYKKQTFEQYKRQQRSQ